MMSTSATGNHRAFINEDVNSSVGGYCRSNLGNLWKGGCCTGIYSRLHPVTFYRWGRVGLVLGYLGSLQTWTVSAQREEKQTGTRGFLWPQGSPVLRMLLRWELSFCDTQASMTEGL